MVWMVAWVSAAAWGDCRLDQVGLAKDESGGKPGPLTHIAIGVGDNTAAGDEVRSGSCVPVTVPIAEGTR
jgi:hypothetical protein